MKHKEGGKPEVTESSDLEAFEEWSVPGEPEAEASVKVEEELDFSAFEEATPEPEAAAPEPEAPEPPAEEETPAPLPHRPAAHDLADSLLALAPDVPVNLVAVIGKTTTTVGEMLRYRTGQVIDLGRPPGESVDLVANGRLIARGELVDIDGQLGIRILKMVK